jgi:hypothetical protein
MSNNFCGIPMSFVDWCGSVCLHAVSIAYVPPVSAGHWLS